MLDFPNEDPSPEVFPRRFPVLPTAYFPSTGINHTAEQLIFWMQTALKSALSIPSTPRLWNYYPTSRLCFFSLLMLVFSMLVSTAHATKLTLAWDPPSSTVAGYRIYYGTVSRSTQNYQFSSSLISGTSYTTPDLANGTYYFAARAFDSANNGSAYSEEISLSINTSGSTSTSPPTASFNASPVSGTTATTFTFTNTSTGNISSWLWNFGDNTTSTAKNAIKTYSKTGTYTVSLTAKGSTGSHTVTKTDYITVSSATPAADFSATPVSGAAPLTVTFNNDSTGNIAGYSWNFGDNATSTASNPTHTYSNTGTYTVKLTATGPAGSNSKTRTGYITVTAPSASSGGLVAAYNFEEASGTTVNDTSGKANHGTISGAIRTTGKYGKALFFDGTNDWVTVNDSTSLDLTTGMTLEAWVNPSELSSKWRTAIIKENAAKLSYVLYANSDANTPVVDTYIKSYNPLKGTSALPLNVWTHLAATSDGATARLYMNGVQVSSRALAGSTLTSSGPLRIGGNNVWGEFFKGRIDDVRIYNRPLTANEIQADMNTPIQ